MSVNRQTCQLFLNSQWVYALSLCLILLLTAGCIHKLERVKVDQEPFSKIIKTSYAATDVLAEIMKKRDFDSNGTIIGSSLVNIDNLTESCSLGRVISEQMMGRMAQHGFKVIELKLRQDSIFIKKNEGEFLLSRELQNISENHHASAVLVGTYAISKYVVFVSVRMIRTSDNSVIASYDYQLPLDFITKSLI
ncbi:MAG: hypothetical protein OMM_03805 [Candidatus Magnetoglobus multicellularis str. Araruama]|uniref:FlgO domain-containing protein n=1 Tax=Candidatus Magnetoglobus multicellularis str. Araruama TaxID=890399 RepID=A0A1V1P407_9BACT|nr:MAG: hypothetical protein OMM_03805 [Candidatus Magnetoglobus multicellularis str. Araruama]